MKKIINKKNHFSLLILSAFSLIVLFIASCQKRQDFDKTLNEGPLIKVTKNIGDFHNKALNYGGEHLFLSSLTQKKLSSTKETYSLSTNPSSLPLDELEPYSDPSVDVVVESVTDYMETIPEYSDAQLYDKEQLISKIEAITTNFNTSNMFSSWNFFLNEPYTINALTPREANLIADIAVIFNNSYGPHRIPYDVHADIMDRLQLLKDQNTNTIWEENEGELFTGMIEIALSSTDYWFTANGQTPLSTQTNPNRALFRKNNPILQKGKIMNHNSEIAFINPLPQTIVPAFIQLDCLGYIISWGQAVYNDSNSPGGLKASGQKNRIVNGLWGAASASLSAMSIFKEFQRLDPSQYENVINH